MGFIKRSARSVGKRFNVGSWTGVNEIKRNTKIYVNMTKDLLNYKNTVKTSKSIQGVGKPMSPSALLARKNIAFLLIVAFSLVGVILFVYGFYLWFVKVFILSGIPAIVFSLVAFGYAFQEFMVYTQVRLGRDKMTFKDLVNWYKNKNSNKAGEK